MTGRAHGPGAGTGTILALALAAAGTLHAQDAPAAWTAEQQAVIDAASVGPVGLESDFEGWAAGYAPEWSYWRMGEPRTRPRDVHMDLVRGVIADGTRIVGFEIEPVDVIVRGDVAMIRYNATETIESPDGTVRSVRFSSASLYAREDGAWKVLASNLYYPPE